MAQPKDLPELLETNIGNDGKIIDADLLPQLTESSRVYCATVGNEIVALAYWQEDFLSRRDMWFLYQVTTKPSWRKRNVAISLLRSLFDYARKLGIRKIYCDIHPDNHPSLKLFRKLGAIESGYITGFDDNVPGDKRIIFRIVL